MAETYHVGELLQTVANERLSGMLSIVKDMVMGNIFLEDGRLTHAECNQGKMGKPALYLLLDMEEAMCEWHEGTPPVTQTLDETVEQSLINFLVESNDQPLTLGVQEPGDELPEPPTQTSIVDYKNCVVALTVEKGAMEGAIYYLTKRETRIGRALSCDVILPETSVSAHHCLIILDRYTLKVRDLGSTNGTEVNGERVNQHVIQAGDILSVGCIDISMTLNIRRSVSVTQALPNHVITSLHERNACKDTVPLKRLNDGSKTENQPISWQTVGADKAGHNHKDSRGNSGLEEMFKKLF
ncbi:MAG: FHA domain-containing protein [Verrucomicrobiota bacterium]